jgi:hypothetical protein
MLHWSDVSPCLLNNLSGAGRELSPRPARCSPADHTDSYVVLAATICYGGLHMGDDDLSGVTYKPVKSKGSNEDEIASSPHMMRGSRR